MAKNLIRGVGIGILATVLSGLFTTQDVDAQSSYNQVGGEVHYNWGAGGPNGLRDNFTATFDQSKNYESGDYFIQTLADDGVRVEVDGQNLINRWSYANGRMDQALWLGVLGGQHTVKTHYRELLNDAVIFSDIVKLDSWAAYYYPNNQLKGYPTAAKVIHPSGNFKKLKEDVNLGSPAKGIPIDHFSARYSSAKRISAGEYIVRTKADDGIRVYIDGKLVLDRWREGAYKEEAIKVSISDRNVPLANERDIHWIEVQYREDTYSSNLEFFLEPYQSSMEGTWLGEIYPNKYLQGTPVVLGGTNAYSKVQDVNFNWGNGSPSKFISTDNFSARFSKTEYLEGGTYLFKANADDGIRVWIDDRKIIDLWKDGVASKEEMVFLESGKHTVRVEYYEYAGPAKLTFSYRPFSKLAISGSTVHYNWGNGGPNGLTDHFTAVFNQSRSFEAGDYFIQTLADDGVKVNFDGKPVINRWGNASGRADQALLLGVGAGNHSVETHYLEFVKSAAIFSDIVKFDSWLAYYYPNTQLQGLPINAKVITPTDSLKSLKENSGFKSPVPGLPFDRFSAKYVSAKRIKAGEYILRTKADDGVRVYLDGRLVLDRWSKGAYSEEAVKIQVSDRTVSNPLEKDVHWIEVQYREDTWSSYLDFHLEPYESSMNGAWLGEFYPNKQLQGNPVIIGGKNSTNKIPNLDYDWERESPHSLIPADNFSARFTKNEEFKAGTYLFRTTSDDGVRVWVDDRLIIDSWKDGITQKEAMVVLDAGMHSIRVEYYEYAGPAMLSLEYKPFDHINITGPSVGYNWIGSGPNGLSDYFTATFNQSRSFDAGDYFIQTIADDGVKVEIDGKNVIDRWGFATNRPDRSLWLNVAGGQHSVKTHYLEYINNAGVFSDIIKLDSWLAYYYSNKDLKGIPTSRKVIASAPNGKLNETFDLGSPANGVPVDHFSAHYTTAKRLTAGEYIIRTKADDGIRVYVDGKLVMDRWASGGYQEKGLKIKIDDRQGVDPAEKDIHWIEIEYREDTSLSYLDFSIEPYSSALNSQTWLGEYYQNTNLTGSALITGGNNASSKLEEINFDWGQGSPDSFVPIDNFSARYTKVADFESGTYVFDIKSDDGVRVWIDGQKVIDKGFNGLWKYPVYLTSGNHKMTVEYFEISGNAHLQLDYSKVSSQKIFYQYNGEVRSNWGLGGPAGLPIDNFEALYEQNKYLNSGDYFVQAFADDGIKVDVDGNMVIDRWTSANGSLDQALLLGLSQGNHTVKTSYLEKLNNAAVFADVVPFGNWLAYYYPNKELQGTPHTARVIQGNINHQLIEDNQLGSPVPEFPEDNFSVRYTTAKRIPAGEYILKTKADDGMRVYVDGQLVLDRWTAGAYQEQTNLITIKDRDVANPAEKNIHWIEVQYKEDSHTSYIQFDLLPIPSTAQFISSAKLPVYRSYQELIDYTLHLTFYNPNNTRYFELGYGDVVYKLEEVKYAARIRTLDGREGWVHKQYLEENITDDFWLIKEARTLRSGPGTNFSSMGMINSGTKVKLLNYMKIEGVYTEWYQVQTETGQRGWIWGAVSTYKNQGFNIIKYEFDKIGTMTNQLSIFTPINTKSSVTADQINSFINYKTGGKMTVMTGMGSSYLEAQKQSGLNAVYLLAHSGLETGWGNSSIVKTKYNFYGIGAIDSQPEEGAYNYDTPEGGIIAGAIWISKNYTFRDQYYNGQLAQPTLDNMRFNNGLHEYASDEAWSSKISYFAEEFYNFINR